jgi:hypothetical protein
MTKQLFVGNISYDTQAPTLRAAFAKYGEVANVEVVTDAGTGRPRGYALVTMATDAAAGEAIAALDGTSLDGRALHVVPEDDAPAASSFLPRAIRRALGYVRYARDKVGAVAVSLFLFDPDTGDLSGVVAGGWDWTRSSFPSRLSDWPTVDDALKTRRIRIVTREVASGPEEGWFETRGIIGSVCVPLVDEGRRMGVLFFDFDAQSGRAEDADAAFLADVGDRCARAIGRASP